MNCLHYRAAHWIQRGIFDNLQSFGELETRVDSVVEEKDRGDIFEIFIEAFLATQSITQRVRHWVVGKIPLELRERYKLPNDGTGIDGIYETHDGTHVAYQVKYRHKSHLTFAEVAPFLGITEAFSDRVIFTNASSLSNIALVRTRWYSEEVFNGLSAGALKQIECWLKEKPLPIIRATPDPDYQLQALADIAKAFASDDRATAVMACGTGKTLISLWAAEQANPQTVLVLVPSLTLLQQTLKEWSEHTSWESRFSYLCVCSDQTVDLKNDEINIDKSDVGFRVDTDPEVVRAFLNRPTDDAKVIFSTYHSSPVVGAGSKEHPRFDFAVFDEAHKTTGHTGTSFSYALSNDNIRVSKRLFLTATPRHIDIRHRDKEGELLVQSMDDPAIYGRRAHILSFHAAANKGIICRYKLLISVIDKQIVDDFTRKNGITLVDGDEIGAQWVANLIALEQAATKVDAKKIISFHSRVATAKEFASREPRGIARYLPGYDVRHVNGKQSSADRAEIIKAFANAEHALLTNARCLTEGINIPAVDMVAFIDPRQSRIDIAQAVGRAMRKPRGATTKTIGYVLVPLFCGVDGESVEDKLTWQEVSFESKEIERVTQKRRKKVVLPINLELLFALEAENVRRKPEAKDRVLINPSTNRPLTRPGLYRRILALGKRAGVPDAHPHRFRDTLAVDMLSRGASPYDVAKILADTIETVERHYAPFTKELRERVRSLIDNGEGLEKTDCTKIAQPVAPSSRIQ